MRLVFLFLIITLVVSIAACQDNNSDSANNASDSALSNTTAILDNNTALGNNTSKSEVSSYQFDEVNAGFVSDLPRTQNKTILALYEKAKSVKSYTVYPAALGTDPGIKYSYYEKTIKIEFTHKKLFSDSDYIDTVFLDTLNKTATGMCLHTDDELCKNRRTKYALNYDELYIVSPYEWYSKLDSLEYVGSELFNNRDVILAKSEYQGKPAKMWIDSHYGIPVKIEIYGQDGYSIMDTYFYRELHANNIKAADMKY